MLRAVRAAGAVRAALEQAGTPIGAYDTLLAGQAIRRGLVLVTANVAEFARVSGLTWQNWAERTFRRRRRLPHRAAAQGGMGQWAWPRIAAVYVIVVTPGILAFAFAQRLFFKGLMEGVLKA